MNAEELKAIQAPIKEKYRSEPASALVTLRAEGTTEAGIACSVDTGRGLVNAGFHSGTGGDGTLVCSGDMLLQALVACAGVTLRAVATAIGVDLKSARITAEGDLDWRGTLGVSKEVPVGFKEIRLRFALDSNATEEQKATLLKLTERYCVILQTIRQSPAVVASIG